MGLFGRRKDREPVPEPAPEVAAEEAGPGEVELADYYRRVALEMVPLGLGEQVVRDRTDGGSEVVPAHVAQVLASCATFELLEDHAYALAQNMRMDPDAFRGLLEDLRERDLLIAHAEAVERFARHRGGPATVTDLAIVTADRPELLERCVASFRDGFERHGREVRIFVADDTSDEGAREANRSRLRGLSEASDLRIAYADVDEKRRFAERLVERLGGGVEREVVDFALFDPLGVGYTTGANRNAVLLHTAGRAVVCADDDVVCELSPPRTPAEGAAVSSRVDETGMWLFADAEEARASIEYEDPDVIGEFERILGGTAGDWIAAHRAGYIDLDHLDDDAFVALADGGLGVALVMCGSAGDSGMGNPAYLLQRGGATRDRIVRDPARYEELRFARQMVRCVPRPTLSTSAFFMTMLSGFDNREVVPPFVPVGRNQDGVYGVTARRCLGTGIAHLPWGVRHEPDVARERGLDEVVDRNAVIPTATVLMAMTEIETPVGRGEYSLEELGSRLARAARLPGRGFERYLEEVSHRVLSRKAGRLDALLHEHGESPEYWAADLEALLDGLHEAALDPLGVTFSDLEEGFGEERLEVGRRLLGEYARLLSAWPRIWSAARSLGESGAGLGQPV